MAKKWFVNADGAGAITSKCKKVRIKVIYVDNKSIYLIGKHSYIGIQKSRATLLSPKIPTLVTTINIKKNTNDLIRIAQDLQE